jgi:hypothetical protein
MYYFLTDAVNDRFVSELRRFWSYDPRHKDLVDNIQSKYSFKERPQKCIIVKSGSAQNLKLSPDQFRGIQQSYCTLTKVDNYPGLSIEWIREDVVAIQNNYGLFPTPPGIYYIEITSSNQNTGEHQFTISPVVNVTNEYVNVTGLTGTLESPFIQGTLRLFEMPSGQLLYDNTNYTSNYEEGTITLNTALLPNTWLLADYKYETNQLGPFAIRDNRASNKALPGIVLAFGKRIQLGDRQAILVSEIREPASLEYGGQWDLSIDIDIIARDVHEQRYMTDMTAMHIQHVLRDRMAEEGLLITEVSIGGETEEPYDDNADDYYFGSSISTSLQVEWAMYVPLVGRIRRISEVTGSTLVSIAGMSDIEVAQVQSNIQIMSNMGLHPYEDPFFANRTKDFELIR